MSDPSFIHKVRALIRKVEAETGMDVLTLRSRLLLDEIASHDDEPLRLTDLMKQVQAGTPPTFYRCIAELEASDWIVRITDPVDGRAYRLKPSTRARRAFRKMSRAVSELMAD